jgi:hypothetical protein
LRRRREAGATIAAENGATDHHLMALFGWTNIRQAQTYAPQANREWLAPDAIRLLIPTRWEQNER